MSGRLACAASGLGSAWGHSHCPLARTRVTLAARGAAQEARDLTIETHVCEDKDRRSIRNVVKHGRVEEVPFLTRVT